jgi:hypothetical protein
VHTRGLTPATLASSAALGLSVVLATAPAALAAGPATVTVRAVGAGDQPVLPLTQVTTNETPVVKDGDSEHSCAGTSAAGALELASKGNWNGGWTAGFGYGVETIEGADYPFGGPDRWAFWLNNQPVGLGTGVWQLLVETFWFLLGLDLRWMTGGGPGLVSVGPCGAGTALSFWRQVCDAMPSKDGDPAANMPAIG